MRIGWDLSGTLPRLLPQRSVHCLTRTACNRNLGEFGKAALIQAHDLPLPSPRRRGDDEVVSAPRRTRPPDVRQKSGVRFSNFELVRLDRNSVEDRSDEALTLVAPAPLRQLNANLQLRHGNRRDRDIITVVDRFAQRIAPALGVDQDRRIEDQSRQGSLTGSMLSRSSRNSLAQASSGRLTRSASLSAFPVPPLVGPMVATGRPWRTTT